MLISKSLAVTRYLLGGSDSVTKGGSPPGGTLTPPVVVSLWTAKTSVCFGSGSAITVYARNSCPRGAGQENVPQIRQQLLDSSAACVAKSIDTRPRKCVTNNVIIT